MDYGGRCVVNSGGDIIGDFTYNDPTAVDGDLEFEWAQFSCFVECGRYSEQLHNFL